MPEIKQNFSAGKMNKDLDERLLPKGEYRHAENIQVSTSEESDVGALENILSNTKLSDGFILEDSVCVGSYADEKNNSLYWFVTSRGKDMVLQWLNSQVTPVLVDTKQGTSEAVLKFDRENIVTGINVIDNLLFWTDNQNEPRKINIDRCIEGTVDQDTHTKLIVPQRSIDLSSSIDIREEHITVIKKSPKTKLTLSMEVEEDSTAELTDAPFIDIFGNLLPMTPGSVIPLTGAGTYIGIRTGTFTNTAGPAIVVGDEFLLQDSTVTNTMPEDYNIKLRVIADLSGSPDGSGGTFPANSFRTEVVDGFVTLGQENWNVLKAAKKEDFFEKQFSRFSYRYKYQDGEYSTFAPFSEIAFKPDIFDYETKKAYNLGMQNKLKELTLKNFIEANILEDVIQIDILYKESNSPNVYIVESLKYDDFRNPTNSWDDNEYKINSDLIYSSLPSNQLLRPFDNVPRKALAQEITGNRLVYGNYVQNYNLETKPVIDATYLQRSGVTFTDGSPQKSLKSLRNYQVGIVYLDEYGRQTPVFSSSRSSFKIPKNEAASSNAIQFTAITPPPAWATSYKVYVKETSNEYYNLAMDRVYKAKDGNIWMSFPSSERNKVDEETFLILKKQLDANSQVQDNLKYKIIAIENEAPVEVKSNNIFLASSNGTGDIENLFSGDTPQVGSSEFQIDEATFKADGGPSIDNITETLSIKFKDTSENITSDFYEVASVEYVAPFYNIKLRTKIKEVDQWIYSDYSTTTTFLASDLNDNLTLRVYKDERKEQPEFDGKFFVKILNDVSTEQYVLKGAYINQEYAATSYIDTFYVGDRGADWTNDPFSIANGSTGAWKSSTRGHWTASGTLGILHFNNGNISSEWFVDQAWYADTHPESNNLQADNLVPDEGWGKGIYRDADGQWYIELSFSQILPDAEYKFQDNSLNFNIASGNNYTTLSSISLNTESLQKAELFAVGSVINQEHVDQSDITANLTKNKIFKFVGDNKDAKYIINGTVTKEKRYNYKSFKEVKDKYDAWYAVASTNLGSSNYQLSAFTGGAQQVSFDNLELAWDEFSEAVNRRITYKIPIALYSDTPTLDSNGAPVYAEADPILNSEFEDTTSGNSHEFINSSYGAWLSTPSGIQFLERSEREDDQLTSNNPAIWETEPKENIDLDIYYEASECFDISLHGTTQELDWFNCYSFGNGVESNRLRDDFNQVIIDKGAVASSTVDFVYEEENRKNGLIHSGIYNSTSGVNNLNQFIAAEKITKDINPTYGSIQKLFSRNTDVITFCEDKVVKILANKDALFNADGNPQLIATENVLGQTIPFVGDYGISQNPESFSKESYRAYFTDKHRGKVLRLSRDGITPISDYGMEKFFKDTLKNQDKLIGSYDQKKNEYNLTLKHNTVSYDEKVRGWSSFKSFIPEQGISVTNFYYTFKDGHLYKHHDDVVTSFNSEVTWNNFYGKQYKSKVTTILSDAPDVVKSFKTVMYEGSQSQVLTNLNDNNYYNLSSKQGWSLQNVKTDQQEGFIPEFIKKEGKWFNNLKGNVINTKDQIDTKNFNFQGIGRPSLVEYFDIPPTVNVIVEVFILPTLDCWFVTNNNNQVLYKRGITGSALPFDDPNEDASTVINPNVTTEQIFGGNVYRQGETVNETVQFKIRPGIDISGGTPHPIVPIEAASFSARHLTPPGPDGERSRVFDIDGNFLQNIDIDDDAGGAVEDIGVDQSTILNEANPNTTIPGPGFIGSTFSPISANVSFLDTDAPLSNNNHVLVNVPIKFTIPVVQDMDTIRIELYLEKDSLNI